MTPELVKHHLCTLWIEKLIERLDEVDGRHPDTRKLIDEAEDFIYG